MTSSNECGIDIGWPDRLHASVSVLCEASAKLQAVLSDKRRFEILTGSNNKESVYVEYKLFNDLLEEALAALIDLSSYDNPDQSFPNLTDWFDFKCENVTFGKHTDRIVIETK